MEALPLESTSSLSLKPGSDIQLITVDDECCQEVVTNSVASGSLIQRVTAITYLCGMNVTSSASNGLIVIGLPRLTKDLKLPPSLAFWPSSVQGLTTASTLLLTGAIADVLGPRPVNLLGCILNSIFMLTCALVKNGEELVILRALQGVATALHLSSSVALVTQVQPRGRERNVAFACLGLSQLLGFSSSLVVGGILIDTLGWRSGWYFCGGLTLLLLLIGWWSLPRGERPGSLRITIRNLKKKVDWVGALLASTSICLLTYFLGLITTGIDRVRSPVALVSLSLSMVATALFVYWVHSRAKKGRMALIPNGLWKNLPFTSICITVALSFAVLNSLDLVTSLYFQEIEHLSALKAAIRMLPSTVVGLALNITTGFVVHKIRANLLVAFASLISAGSPLLMAVIQPGWSYWKCAFPAQILMPFSIDVLFTIGLIIITEAFPEEQHAVAGAVFNTAAQFGNTMGLALMQVISTWVTEQQKTTKPFTKALMEGYRATFWAMLAFLLVCSIVGAIGLRRAGRVGLRHR
ncbi:related to aminotriazole resistance protein [Fusarium fujikuroi]|nr:related to aminotriazole resistance protein [Fusarium fujikuroi]SCO24286.1 related to aminotriazole resistance protein [Fusarium fujikuroi]SCO25576.1 related to aminotriazole resistance protein [Fusarium fujikuroi]